MLTARIRPIHCCRGLTQVHMLDFLSVIITYVNHDGVSDCRNNIPVTCNQYLSVSQGAAPYWTSTCTRALLLYMFVHTSCAALCCPTIRQYAVVSLLCVFCLSLCLSFCMYATITDFSAVEKDNGAKFCTLVRLLSGISFSDFSELWLAWSHGGGITTGWVNRNWPPWHRHSELGAAA